MLVKLPFYPLCTKVQKSKINGCKMGCQQLVEFLIHQDSMTWNVPLLEQTFFPRDVEIIQQMPLSLRRPVDRFIWASTKKGVFTVKSAYQLQMAAQHSAEGSSSNSASSSSCIWRALWSTLVQPKVKVFMWWACSNILPTYTKLFDKGISHSFSC